MVLVGVFLDHVNYTTVLFTFTSICCLLWLKGRHKSRVKIPQGPTGLPLVGYIPFLGSEPYKKFANMRKVYGNIIGLYLGRQYTVILNEYKIAKEVWSNPLCFDRAPGVFGILPERGFMELNGKAWQEQRRFCVAAIKDVGLGTGKWEDLMLEEVNVLVQKLRDLRGKPTDISEDLTYSLTSNVIALLIGRRLDEKKEAADLKKCIDYTRYSLRYAGLSKPPNILPFLRKFYTFFKIDGYDKVFKVIKEFHSLLRDEIYRHKNAQNSKNAHDFISVYLDKISEITDSKNKMHSFSDRMLEGNLSILFLGSSDTTYSSLSWLFRLMARYKDIQNRVYKELIENVGRTGRARYEERDRIPFTFAVLMEGQRFGTVTPLSPNRIVKQDIQVDGQLLRKGTEVILNTWALHNDPDYWQNPEKFIPERFLTDNGTTIMKQPESFGPFSFGGRNCPGEVIAWSELLFYFSEVVKNFEISTQQGIEPHFNTIPGIVVHLAPQPLCFKERKD